MDLHVKSSLAGAVALAVLLLLVLVRIPMRSKTSALMPLVSTQRTVVLLVPGASLSDWQNGENAVWSSGKAVSMGVFPNRLPWRTGSAKLTTLNPVTSRDLVKACVSLGGETLGSALEKAGIRCAALGGDPAARAFLGSAAPGSLLVYDNADAEPRWRSEKPDAVDGFVTDPDRFAAAIHTADAPKAAPFLLVATFDDLLRCDAYAPLSRPKAIRAQRQAALRRLETLLVQLTGTGQNALPDSTSLVVITPTPAMTAAERGELLGPVLLWQREAPQTAGFLLTSASTRHTPGFLAPGDICATVLRLAGSPEGSGAGRPAARLVTGNAPFTDAGNLDERVASWAAQFREITFLVSLPWLLAGLLLSAALLLKGRVRFACAIGAVILPIALIIAAPFASSEPGKEAFVYAIAGLVTLSAVLLCLVLAKRWADTSVLRVVFLVTASVILLDTLTGGALLARSPLSYSPVVAARFYGIGNEVSGVFLGASLLTVGLLCPTPLGAALGGASVALVSGLPLFGADAGGFIADLIGFGVLFAFLAGARAENRRRAVVKASLSAAVVVLALLSLYVLGSGRQSAATRTHVGEAVVSARREGGSGALLPLIRRKAATGIRLLYSSPWAVLLLTEVGLCVWFWRRRSRSGAANALLTSAVYPAVFVAAGALLLVNDSGVVAAATCLLYPTTGLLLAETPPIPPPNSAEMSSAHD